ncbi:BTB/POZ domain-containing protein [Perilla frutescens var. frutescens]|nr:BTB/POZ domain-containing protein [Perilla frutescens var. frutescens]
MTKEHSHSKNSESSSARERRGGGEMCRAVLDCNLASLCDHIQSEGFNNGVFSDVVLNAMGSTYHLHRLILSRSSYFRKVNGIEEVDNPVLVGLLTDEPEGSTKYIGGVSSSLMRFPGGLETRVKCFGPKSSAHFLVERPESANCSTPNRIEKERHTRPTIGSSLWKPVYYSTSVEASEKQAANSARGFVNVLLISDNLGCASNMETGDDPLLVSERSHLWWLENVRQCLDKWNNMHMSTSPFKHLIDLPALHFNAPLYQQLLRCLDKQSRASNTLRFVINGDALVFGPTKFAVMTGLKFNGYTAPPGALGGKQNLTLVEVHDRFRDECMEMNGSTHLCFQLGLLFILYSTILFRGRVTDQIEMNYFHLVDDLEAFNKFPWGLVGYNFLIQSTHEARELLDRLTIEPNDAGGYPMEVHAGGFNMALILWAYEVMPDLAAVCSRRLGSQMDRIPRMLWWYTNNFANPTTVKQLFSRRRKMVKTPLVVTCEESRILSNTGPYSTPHLPCTPFASLHRGCDKAGQPLVPNVDVGLQNLRLRFMVPEIFTRTDGATGATPVQRTFEGPQSAPPKPVIPILPDNAGYRHPNQGSSSVPPPRKSHPDHLARKKDVNMLTVSEISQRLENVEELCHSLVATPFYTMKFPSPAPVDFRSASPQFAGVLPSDEIRTVPCRRLSFDEMGPTSADAAAGATCSRPNNIPVPTRMSLGVVRPWFDNLSNPDCWLQDQHIDALVALIMRQAKVEDVLRGKMSMSVMDTVFWDILQQDDWTMVEEIVVPFAKGSYIEDWGERWAVTRRVVGVAHLKTNHWLSYHISIDEQMIIVYDSTSKDSDWSAVKQAFEKMSTYLPHICRSCGILPMKDGALQPLGNKFEVLLHEYTPQQENGSDCGVMAVQYVECLIRNRPLSSIVPRLCSYRRNRFCAQLFQFGLKVLGSRSAAGAGGSSTL